MMAIQLPRVTLPDRQESLLTTTHKEKFSYTKYAFT